MSADQRKKRLSSANVFGYSSREQYRAKKKHLSSSQFDLNWKLNSHTPLKWDDNEKRAVAKGEQIGLSKRDLRPFKALAPHHNSSLADVIAIPKDVFELDDLANVLSYEVWESILSEKERSHLTQFLPRGVNPEEVVQDLLVGENLHFGNQFLKWSSMLCSGELHPEAVLHYDETSRANRNAYYSELQKYHDNMIRNLQKLKDRCANAKNPEAEIEQMMWRTRKQPGKEARHHNREQCVAADEKAWSSDNQSPLKAKGELLRSKDTRKDKDGKQVGSLDGKSKPKKKEKFPKAIVNNGDGSKYMSYVKISKSQHELVRSMKQSGNSIQSKALNRVIGNLTSFNVKPYVMFEEEEQKRIEDYWSNLAKDDIPSAFSKWGMIQSERGDIMNSLCLEIEDKLKHLIEEEETDHSEGTPYNEEGSVHSDETEQTQEDEAPPAEESASDDGQDSDPSSSHKEQSSLQMPSLDVNQFSEEQQASLQMPSLDVNQKCSSMDLNEEDNHISPKLNKDESCSASEFPEKKTRDIMVNQEVPHSSARDDAWPTMVGSGSSFCSSAIDYASCSSVPLKIPEPIEHQTAQLMDLESSSIPEVNPSKSMLPQQSDQLSFFGSYQNNNYHEEPKKIPLGGFHPTASLLIEPNQFPAPSFPLEPRLRAQSNFYLHPNNIPENIYPDNTIFSIPRPEQFTPINMRDWSNAPRFSAPPPMHPPLTNSMDRLTQNWFPVENRALQPGWPGSEVFQNLSIGSGSIGGDQSLYSVLTQCSSLQPVAPAFSSMVGPPGNFAEDLGIGIPRTNPLPPPHSVSVSPLDYLSGGHHDVAPSTLKTGDMGWMNLQDSTGKPFPKSWNQ